MHDTLTNIKKTPSHSDSSDISSTTAPTGVLLLSWLFVVVQLYVDGSYGRFVFNIPNPFVRHMHVPYRSYRQSTQKHRRSMRHPPISTHQKRSNAVANAVRSIRSVQCCWCRQCRLGRRCLIAHREPCPLVHYRYQCSVKCLTWKRRSAEMFLPPQKPTQQHLGPGQQNNKNGTD